MANETKFFTPHIFQDHDQAILEMKVDADGAYVLRTDFESVKAELEALKEAHSDSAGA